MSGELDIALVSVRGGAFALTHQPKLKSLSALRALGVTHVVTLLAELEVYWFGVNETALVEGYADKR